MFALVVPPMTASVSPSVPWSADVGPHLPRAEAAARRLLGCDHLAADVVQEALLVLWQQPERPPDLCGWLVLAVVHRARHLRRTLQRRRHHEHHAATTRCSLHPDCDNPLHHAHAHELADRLAAAVDGLPVPQRTVYELYARTGLDYEALAAHLHLPIGTVRSRLHRARRAVQEALPASG